MQRWIFQRVLDLGWTVERFGEFDRNLNRYRGDYRSSHKAERFGKKYQWIAFYEMLAFMSDNYELRASRFSEDCEPYSGPWQFSYARNIDPSFVLKSAGGAFAQEGGRPWWSTIVYESWDADNRAWLREAADLPDPRRLMEARKPNDASEWFVLDAFSKWRIPTPIGEDEYRIPSQQLWYMTKAYLIKTENLETYLDWARGQSYWGRWMPEAKSLHEVFFGEYYWAPAYTDHNTEWHGVPGWTGGEDDRKIPVPILPATEGYSCEGNGFDCSLESGANINLPRKLIADEMALRWNGVEGKWYAGDGQLVAFDPAVHEGGPGSLLIRKDRFSEYLRSHGYSLFWTFLGEKQIIGGASDFRGHVEISGTYWFDGEKIQGAYASKCTLPGKGA